MGIYRVFIERKKKLKSLTMKWNKLALLYLNKYLQCVM